MVERAEAALAAAAELQAEGELAVGCMGVLLVTKEAVKAANGVGSGGAVAAARPAGEKVSLMADWMAARGEDLYEAARAARGAETLAAGRTVGWMGGAMVGWMAAMQEGVQEAIAVVVLEDEQETASQEVVATVLVEVGVEVTDVEMEISEWVAAKAAVASLVGSLEVDE